jgi:hypothetical protein
MSFRDLMEEGLQNAKVLEVVRYLAFPSLSSSHVRGAQFIKQENVFNLLLAWIAGRLQINQNQDGFLKNA